VAFAFRNTATQSQVLRWVENQPTAILILVGILLDLFVGWVEYATGYEIDSAVFYLAPIALVTRCVGLTTGIFMSVLCAATWLVADFASGHEHSHSLIPYWNALVNFGFFIAFSVALAKIKDSMELLREMTETDPLTGILNTRGFEQRARVEIDRLSRYKRALSVAYLDVDNFKAVNDSFGHSVGDGLLVRLAAVLRASIREIDVLARLGGDEFVILFPETKSELAQRAMNRIKDRLLEEVRENGWPVTVSIGLVTFLSPPVSLDEMVRKADYLMYQAKNHGKNGLVSSIHPDEDSSA